MQLVSREILFDVMKKKKPISFSNVNALNESNSSAYDEFCRYATSTYEQSTDMEMFSNAMLNYMKNNKQDIRFIGQGSSRIVFALANGTALKLAKTKAGIAQNKQEAKICMNPLMKYAIFPDFYGADTKDWLSLNCELCTKAESRDFKQLFKAQPKTITNIIEFILKLKLEDFQFSQAINYFKSLENHAAANLFKQLLEKDNEQMIALKSLIEFYRKNGQDELLLGDIEEIENWGLTIRNGQKVLIIIDAGFNEQVHQEFYSHSTHNSDNWR